MDTKKGASMAESLKTLPYVTEVKTGNVPLCNGTGAWLGDINGCLTLHKSDMPLNSGKFNIIIMLTLMTETVIAMVCKSFCFL